MSKKEPFETKPPSQYRKEEFYWRGGDPLTEQETLREEYRAALNQYREAERQKKEIERQLYEAQDTLSEREGYTSKLATFLDGNPDEQREENAKRQILREKETEIREKTQQLDEYKHKQNKSFAGTLQSELAFLMIEIQRTEQTVTVSEKSKIDSKRQHAALECNPLFQQVQFKEFYADYLQQKNKSLKQCVEDRNKAVALAKTEMAGRDRDSWDQRNKMEGNIEIKIANRELQRKLDFHKAKHKAYIDYMFHVIESLNDRMDDLEMEEDKVDIQDLRSQVYPDEEPEEQCLDEEPVEEEEEQNDYYYYKTIKPKAKERSVNTSANKTRKKSNKKKTPEEKEKERQREERRQAKEERREMLLSELRREQQIEMDRAEEEKQRNFAQHTQNSQKARQQSDRERKRIQQELYGLPPDEEDEEPPEERQSKPTTQLGKRKGPQITRPMTSKSNSRAGRPTKTAQPYQKQRQSPLKPSAAIKDNLNQNSDFDSDDIDRRANEMAHEDSFNDENSFDKSFEKKEEDSFDKSSEKKEEDSFDKEEKKEESDSFDKSSEKKEEDSFDKSSEKKDDEDSFDKEEKKDESDSFDKEEEKKDDDDSFDKSSEKKDDEDSFDKEEKKSDDDSFEKSEEKKDEDSFDKSEEKKSEDSFDKSSEKKEDSFEKDDFEDDDDFD